MLKDGWTYRRQYLDEYGHPNIEGYIFTDPNGNKHPVFGFWDEAIPYPAESLGEDRSL